VRALQALVRIPTVSDRDPTRVGGDAFDRLLTELATWFPVLHDRLELTRVGTHGLLFHWAGASPERPIVLMAHLDVVPVDGEAPWQHDPFGGEVHASPSGPAIWGRGTLDDKGCVVGICESVESLLEAGHVPAQDVWLSFGCDEEVGGTAAIEAVGVLRDRGVTPWLVLDEGGAIASGAFPGVKAPLGVIGVTEKGTTSLELVAEGRGGHASTPAKNGPTTRIARAILRVEKSPFPASAPAPPAVVPGHHPRTDPVRRTGGGPASPSSRSPRTPALRSDRETGAVPNRRRQARRSAPDRARGISGRPTAGGPPD